MELSANMVVFICCGLVLTVKLTGAAKWGLWRREVEVEGGGPGKLSWLECQCIKQETQVRILVQARIFSLKLTIQDLQDSYSEN